MILLLCQFVNYIEVKKLPVSPFGTRKGRSKLYAENVRRLMANEALHTLWMSLLAININVKISINSFLCVSRVHSCLALMIRTSTIPGPNNRMFSYFSNLWITYIIYHTKFYYVTSRSFILWVSFIYLKTILCCSYVAGQSYSFRCWISRETSLSCCS